MASMGRLEFSRLSAAWSGEARDFTPLLSQQIDLLGSALGVDLAAIGEAEVSTDGGRRIDIVAQDSEGCDFVIENQYGRADHDHLTRGLAYAVAREAKGLIVVAEEHRDEFRAVATYLNDMAQHDAERGIRVWLVEAKAIDDSRWAPLFTAVVKPNSFTEAVEQTRRPEPVELRMQRFWDQFSDSECRAAAELVLGSWVGAGHRRRPGPNHVVLEAVGPSTSRVRTVVAIYSDGRVMIPFSGYDGINSGIPIPELMTAEFRSRANELFGLNGKERLARTAPGWLTRATAQPLLDFAEQVARAYQDALIQQDASGSV